MSINILFPIAGMICLRIFWSIRNKTSNAKLLTVVVGIVLIFMPEFFPNLLLQNWNSIKEIKNKKIASIILQPSTPGWDVNLVDSIFKIENPNIIAYLTNELQHTRLYAPNHPTRTWEVKLTLVTSTNDSTSIEIDKVDDQGGVIYTEHSEFLKKGLAEYLEAVVNYQHPVKGK